jgi:beta-lactamase superfamily II metal-dependent hydrolase
MKQAKALMESQVKLYFPLLLNHHLMKKIFFALFMHLIVLVTCAQQELHIHHINIENGDATLIGIYDVAQHSYTSKILIDGGQIDAKLMLLPYIKKMIGTDAAASHFDYVILTHYHDDHYTGLLALKDGRLTADSIIDPGGYKVATYFKHSATAGTKPDSLKIAKAWLTMLKVATHKVPEPFIKGRSKILLRFDATASTSIGKKIIIGKVGNNDVELLCIAGWGNTLSAGGQIKKNPGPKKSNANNYTLVFVLSCGEFRYFIGGDMGGSGAAYIDQETTVTQFFHDAYPVSVSVSGGETIAGHVCGFKANHHGSKASNTPAFMGGMRPAITITSGGDNKSWHLPNPEYIKCLANVIPLTTSNNSDDSIFNRGVYFTNLYDFSTSFTSLKTANTKFKAKAGISYSYGNIPNTPKCSYLIKVTDETALQDKSVFEAGRVDITQAAPYTRLAYFFCHKK